MPGSPTISTELPFARVGAFPAAGQDAKVLFAADKRSEQSGRPFLRRPPLTRTMR